MYYPVSSVLIEFLILSIIEKQDSYGYEISQTIKIVADIKESTLYPILKKIRNCWLCHHLFAGISRAKAEILHYYCTWTWTHSLFARRMEGLQGAD